MNNPNSSDNPRTAQIRLFFTGFSMGIADLVPGVSGGSIALLLGIYDELIDSIKLVTSDALKLLLRGKLKQAWAAVPFTFLIPVFAGILLAIFGFVRVVEFLLEAYPVYIWSLFFGLIIGTARIIARRVGEWTMQRYVVAAIAVVAVFVVVGLPAATSEATITGMLLTGAIAICAMILPGISGSLIMLILGQYENVISAVSELKLQLLASFAAGAAVGLALFSRLLSWLLHHHHNTTMAFLVGMMVGALRAVWPWRVELASGQYSSYLPEFDLTLLAAATLSVLGYLLVIQLEKAGIAREHDDL